jgi:hypothetical protein
MPQQSAGSFSTQSRFQRFGHAGVEHDALMLEPKAARSKRTNRCRGEVGVEIFRPSGWEPAHVHKLEPELGKKQIGNSTGLFHGHFWYGFSAALRSRRWSLW